MWVAVVAVVVAVVVVLAVLLLAGVFSSGGGQGGTGTPLYYTQAAPEGAGGVQNSSEGPWTLIAVEGFGISTSTSGSTAAGSLDDGCSSSPLPNTPPSATIPATPSGSTPGTEAAWIFLAENPSDQILLYVVTAAASYPLMVVTGACTSDFNMLSSLTGVTVANATEVVENANANGGSSFLAGQPNALVIIALFGAGLEGSPNPYWAVEYNSCGLSSSGTGTVFVALYDAVDGSVVSPPTTESTSC